MALRSRRIISSTAEHCVNFIILFCLFDFFFSIPSLTSIFSALVDFTSGKVLKEPTPISYTSGRSFLGAQTFVVGRFPGIEKSLMLVFEDIVCGFIIAFIYFIYFTYYYFTFLYFQLKEFLYVWLGDIVEYTPPAGSITWVWFHVFVPLSVVVVLIISLIYILEPLSLYGK